jgi:7-keto-8-aminopelargonate synthetase-like enzyme
MRVLHMELTAQAPSRWGGGLAAAKQLEAELSDFVEHAHVVLFPTGWAAGYGSIKALIRPYDHIVIDILAHDCLQHGASASTPNISRFPHNDLSGLSKRLEKIRRQDPEAAILVVTESLFSMDSDHADMKKFVEICRTFDATTLVDVAHDLGVLGPDGKGVLAESGVLQDIDFIVGSFSKTFACIGGFLAAHSRAATYYARGFSGSYTFSNYLIPPQIAAIREALRIVRTPAIFENATLLKQSHCSNGYVSASGADLRARTLAGAARLRSGLTDAGFQVFGRTSALVLPLIGDEGIARRAYRECLENGVILNSIEYPACRRGAARFRLQITPQHCDAELQTAIDALSNALRKARR